MPAILLTFRWSGTPFAVPLSGVREVVRLQELVPVPGAVAPLAGLLDVRGEALRVMDLRPLMLPLLHALPLRSSGPRTDLDGQPVAPRDVLVVADLAGEPVGIVCDEVIGVDDSQVAQPVAGLPPYVLGVIPGPVPVLDVAGMLAVTGTGVAAADPPSEVEKSEPEPAVRSTSSGAKVRPIRAKSNGRRSGAPGTVQPAGPGDGDGNGNGEEPLAAGGQDYPAAGAPAGWRRVRLDDWGA
jgi:chemotaxis signal transduction protein